MGLEDSTEDDNVAATAENNEFEQWAKDRVALDRVKVEEQLCLTWRRSTSRRHR